MTPRPTDGAADVESFREDFLAITRGPTPESVHPDEDFWVRFASDELSDDERERLVDHVIVCEGCAAVYRAVAHVRDKASGFDLGAPKPQGPSVSRAWLGPGLALAAGLILAAGVAVTLRSGRSESQLPVETTAAAPTTPAAPAPPEPRAWALGGGAPEVRLPASLALSIRGVDAERDAVLREFGAAIAPYRQGRFKEAADALAPLAARRPGVPEIAFYLGASRLLAGEHAAAVEPLREARASTVLAGDARWYEAVALERSGQAQEADAALRPLCDAPGPYRDRACAIVGLAR